MPWSRKYPGPFELDNEILQKKIEALIKKEQNEAEGGSAPDLDQVPPVRIEFKNLANRL